MERFGSAPKFIESSKPFCHIHIEKEAAYERINTGYFSKDPVSKGMPSLKIGNFNELSVDRIEGDTLFLEGDICISRREAPSHFTIKDKLNVFVYYDSEDRLTATTKIPLAKVGQFAFLEIVSLQEIGAFLEWGLPKNLFLPFREQIGDLRKGQKVLVFIYLDKSGRISASMRTDKHAQETSIYYKNGEKVTFIIAGKTELGYKAIFNHHCLGILYFNEVFQPLNIGETHEGFIKKIREDGKFDLGLGEPGHKAAIAVSEKILMALEKEDGFLPINDKTEAEIIYERFGVSKKKFKMAVGNLLKQNLITFEKNGVKKKD